MIVHLNQWTYVSVCHKGRSSALYYLISTFPICKTISLPPIGSFQYANDTTIYFSCPAPELQRCAQELNSTLNTVSSWSNDYHLALNSKKTKTMLLSTSPISLVHSLYKNRPAIAISDSTLEYVNVSKLLGVHFHKHLNWNEHVQATCKSCYGTIQIIRKLKNFAGYRLRKHLVESLLWHRLLPFAGISTKTFTTCLSS